MIPPGTAGKPPRHWLVVDWTGLMETAPANSCPSCQLRGPVAPGDDMVSSPAEKSFTIPIIEKHPAGGNGDPPDRFHHARCGKPNPTRLLLSHGACARGEMFLWPTSSSRAPGDDTVTSVDIENHIYLCYLNNPGAETEIPCVDNAPQGMETQPHWLVAVSYRAGIQRGFPLWPARKSRRTRGRLGVIPG